MSRRLLSAYSGLSHQQPDGCVIASPIFRAKCRLRPITRSPQSHRMHWQEVEPRRRLGGGSGALTLIGRCGRIFHRFRRSTRNPFEWNQQTAKAHRHRFRQGNRIVERGLRGRCEHGSYLARDCSPDCGRRTPNDISGEVSGER